MFSLVFFKTTIYYPSYMFTHFYENASDLRVILFTNKYFNYGKMMKIKYE